MWHVGERSISFILAYMNVNMCMRNNDICGVGFFLSNASHMVVQMSMHFA